MDLKRKADENPDILSDPSFKIWKPEPDMAIVEATYKAMMEAWLFGLRYAKGSDSSDFADAGINMSFDLKYEDAIKIAGSRKAVTPSDYRKLSEHIKQQAFTVGRLSQLDMVSKAKAVYMKAIEAEKVGDIGSFIRDMAAVDSKAAGLVGYYQMVYRTNIQSDYNAAKAWKLQEDPPVFLQFVAIEDERTSDICSAKAGVTLPYNDTFWDNNWPPLHYNCRSTVRSIDADEAREMGLLDDNGKLTKRIKPKDIVKPQGTFGKKPTKDNAFWGATPLQHARIAADMIEDEINDVAGRTVCKDFSEPKEGYTYVETTKGGLRYENSLKDAQEFKNNIKIADTIVNDKGCYIELQRADGPKFSRNCDAWINGVEKLEFKTLKTDKFDNMANELFKGFSQADTVAVSIPKKNIDVVKDAIEDMSKTIGRRRPGAKALYVVVEDKVATIPVADFGNRDRVQSLLDNLS